MKAKNLVINTAERLVDKLRKNQPRTMNGKYNSQVEKELKKLIDYCERLKCEMKE